MGKELTFLFSLQLQDSVAKAKSNYEQALDQYKTSKAKYEDHYLKGKYIEIQIVNIVYSC